MTDYKSLCQNLKAISENVTNRITVLANASALIADAMDDLNWCGFYLAEGDNLLLGPFQGKVACTEIPFGKGVCGTAWERKETVLVKNVHEFEGHIACDSASNSEIVVPIMLGGAVYGVLDIDSPSLSRFNEEDRKGLQEVVAVLTEILGRIK